MSECGPVDPASLTIPPPEVTTIELADGVVIGVRRAGNGPPLVLLHGIGGTSAGFGPQFVDLASRFTVIAWDAPGYGVSTALPTLEPTVMEYSERLNRLLDRLSVDQAHILGASWGSLIATDFVARHPDKALSLVSCGPSIGYARLSPGEREAMVAARLGTTGPLGAPAERLLAPQASSLVRDVLEQDRARLDRRGFEQATRMLLATDGATLAQGVRCPTLIIGGAQDRVCPDHAQRLHELIPGSRLLVLDHCGHVPNLEMLNIVHDAVFEFADRCA